MCIIDNEKIKSILYSISNEKLLPNFKNLKSDQIKYKNNKDIVTSLDIEIENSLKEILPKLIKNSNFIGEEIYTYKPQILNYYNQAQYCWTVDPIDGTLNFVRGKENFAIMIALTYGSKIIQSWIYKPITQEFMYSIYNKGTYLDNKRIKINKSSSIANSIGSISTKYWNKNIEDKIKLLKNCFKSINSYGSIGCEYFDIALGKRDFTLLSKLSPWDHLPGVLVVREAGGHDSHFDNKPYTFNRKYENLIVSNSRELNLEIINKLKEINNGY